MKQKNETLRKLKTMQKNSRGHLLRTNFRIMKYGIIGYGRNIWLSITSTFVMTLTLTLLFATATASLVLSSTADKMREKVDITIYFKPNTEIITLEKIKKKFSADSNIRQISYTTTEEEFNKFIEETKKNNENNLLSALDDPDMKELMLSSMPSALRIKVYDTNKLNTIKEIVNTDSEVHENLDPKKEPTYDTNDTAIETITSWSNIAKTGGLAISLILLVISVLVIFNTIRMAIYSRSEEIYMEKLVGADNHFIRGPFLIEAIMSGFFAGILSTIIGFFLFRLIAPKLSGYDIDVTLVSSFVNSPSIFLIGLALTILGIFIAFLSSSIAVRKYLKRL